jgi:GNAT superfamily N-acetyltransferase
VEDLIIREIAGGDAAAAAVLTGELGHQVPAEVMQRRIEELCGLTNRVVYVACLAGEVVGWIEISETHHLSAGSRAEIGGLVVASQVRSRRIGHCLIAQAEEWVKRRGLERMVVRSRSQRERAHQFYLREGYARTKTSAVFTKGLK